MKDGFKESLSRINNLMWVIITISIGLLLFEPKSQNLSVLGIQISASRLFFVAPVILMATLLARQVLLEISFISFKSQKIHQS